MDQFMQKVLFVFWIFFLFNSNANADYSLSDGTYCDGTGWELYKDEKCFKLIQNWATRDAANNSCAQEWLQTDSTVPQLVTIKSAEEQNFLTKWVFVEEEVMINVWIGAKRLTDSNDFVWDDGSAVEFTNWVDDAPSDEAKSACVVMQSKYVKSLPKANLPDTNGKWKNVFCGQPSYFVCEKRPRWSIVKLQQTLLGQRKELAETKNELANTQNALSSTQNDLSITNNDLIVTKNELSVTKNDLTATKSQLTATKNDLSTTNANVANLKQTIIPIGFIYTQLPKDKSPIEIWPWMTWTDVSDTYGGVFFRVSGGGSESFGTIQPENSPRLVRLETFQSWNPSYTIDKLNHNLTLSEYAVGQSTTLSALFHTGDFSLSNHLLLRFVKSDGEVRPRNMAFRVWKRTS